MHPQDPTHHRRSRARSMLTALGAAVAPTLAVAAPGAATDDQSADFAVLVRGELFTDDLEAARQAHDVVAAGGEDAARSAGDVYHLAALSTEVLGGSEGSVLGIDRWASAEGTEAFDSDIEAVYGDPAFAEAFATLLEAPPTFTIYRSSDWYQWP